MKRLLLAAIALSMYGCGPTLAPARDFGQWEQTDPEIRKWYRSLRMPDAPDSSCCGEADAYWADSFEVDGDQYVAILTDERDIPDRVKREPGTRIKVPNHKIKFDQSNPTGHGIIFLAPGSADHFVYCYLPPGGV